MILTRRKLIKVAAPALIGFAVPKIIRPAEARFPHGTPFPSIPLSTSDSRFAANTSGGGGVGTNLTTGNVANKFWSENPTYTDGTPCWSWSITSGVLNVNQSWVDWREGPRITSSGGTMNIDQCFINCVGKTGDHADGAQWFGATGTSIVNFTNCCFRSYTDAEALSIYGAGFIGSDAIFFADSSSGTVTFNNCLFWGGSRGVTIDCDTGTTHVSCINSFWAMSPNHVPYAFSGAGGYGYLIQPTGGTLVIDAWSNNFDATVSGGVITPFNLIPNPTSVGNEWGQ